MKQHPLADRLDHTLERWRGSRPDLDLSALALVSRVLRAGHFLQVKLDDLAAGYGLSHRGDLEVLTELDVVGPLAPSVLAEDLLLTTGGMTVRLNRLQTAGLVERRPNPQDGRGVLIHLTPMGKELAGHALTNLLNTQSAMVEALQPSDRGALTELLRTLLRGLGDVPTFSAPITAIRRQ